MTIKKYLVAALTGLTLGAASMHQLKDSIDYVFNSIRYRSSKSDLPKDLAFNLDVTFEETSDGLEFFLSDGDSSYKISFDDNELIVGDIYHAWSHSSKADRKRIIFNEWSSLSREDQANVLESLGYENLWSIVPVEVKRDLLRGSIQSGLKHKLEDAKSYLSFFGGEE